MGAGTNKIVQTAGSGVHKTGAVFLLCRNSAIGHASQAKQLDITSWQTCAYSEWCHIPIFLLTTSSEQRSREGVMTQNVHKEGIEQAILRS